MSDLKCIKCRSEYDLDYDSLKETGEMFCNKCHTRWYDPFFAKQPKNNKIKEENE